MVDPGNVLTGGTGEVVLLVRQYRLLISGLSYGMSGGGSTPRRHRKWPLSGNAWKKLVYRLSILGRSVVEMLGR